MTAMLTDVIIISKSKIKFDVTVCFLIADKLHMETSMDRKRTLCVYWSI